MPAAGMPVGWLRESSVPGRNGNDEERVTPLATKQAAAATAPSTRDRQRNAVMASGMMRRRALPPDWAPTRRKPQLWHRDRDRPAVDRPAAPALPSARGPPPRRRPRSASGVSPQADGAEEPASSRDDALVLPQLVLPPDGTGGRTLDKKSRHSNLLQTFSAREPPAARSSRTRRRAKGPIRRQGTRPPGQPFEYVSALIPSSPGTVRNKRASRVNHKAAIRKPAPQTLVSALKDPMVPVPPAGARGTVSRHAPGTVRVEHTGMSTHAGTGADGVFADITEAPLAAEDSFASSAGEVEEVEVEVVEEEEEEVELFDNESPSATDTPHRSGATSTKLVSLDSSSAANKKMHQSADGGMSMLLSVDEGGAAKKSSRRKKKGKGGKGKLKKLQSLDAEDEGVAAAAESEGGGGMRSSNRLVRQKSRDSANAVIIGIQEARIKEVRVCMYHISSDATAACRHRRRR
eukprot:SAG22_NODE_581_length_8895_cov_2.587767_7_plen_462_part_00